MPGFSYGSSSATYALKSHLYSYKNENLPWYMVLGHNNSGAYVMWDDRHNAYTLKPPSGALREDNFELGVSDIERDPLGQHYAVASGGGTSGGRLRVFRVSDGELLLDQPVPASGSFNGYGRFAAYSPDGQFLSFGFNRDPFVKVYHRDGDTYTALPDPISPSAPTGTKVDEFTILSEDIFGFWSGWSTVSPTPGVFGKLTSPPSTEFSSLTSFFTQNFGDLSLWVTFSQSGMKDEMAGYWLVSEGLGQVSIDVASLNTITAPTTLSWTGIDFYMADNESYTIEVWDGPPSSVWYPSDNLNYMDIRDGIWISNTEFLVSWRGLDGSTLTLFRVSETSEGYIVEDAEAFGGLSTDGGSYPMVVSDEPAYFLDNFCLSPLDNRVVARYLETGKLVYIDLTTSGVSYPVTGEAPDFPEGVELVSSLAVSNSGEWMVAGVSSVPGVLIRVVTWKFGSSGWELFGGYPSPEVTETETGTGTEVTSTGSFTTEELPPAFPDFPAYSPGGISFASDDKTIAFAVSGAPRFVLYRIEGEEFIKYEDPATFFPNNGIKVALITREDD